MQKLYETKERPKRAFLVSISAGEPSDEPRAKELQGLCETLELEIIAHEKVRVREKSPKFCMGSGKAEELSKKAQEMEADLFVFDLDPSPSQQRSWEELSGIPVVDRQELIIRIFADRAITREAELQVKLAELTYFLPRLTHKYIDLSRQRGGRYGTKGSGETKFETDRRKIEKRITQLEKDIENVGKQRKMQRQQRQRSNIPVCAIVGYTNTGKSSLLNVLTGANVLAENKLFATLDAVTRRYEPIPGKQVLLTDTVGFIRQLPHSLIKAFRSTLEEAALANILIHILDASDPDIENNNETTLSVLNSLGARDIPMITLLNKIDRLEVEVEVKVKAKVTVTETEREPEYENEETVLEGLLNRFPGSIPVSVKNKTGLDTLNKRIIELAKL